MKALLIALVLGAVGYFVFIYEEPLGDGVSPRNTQIEKNDNDNLREEFDIENTSYEGAITETYNTYKKGINDAKEAVKNIENRNR